jgi:hypothetical protein
MSTAREHDPQGVLRQQLSCRTNGQAAHRGVGIQKTRAAHEINSATPMAINTRMIAG